MSESHTPPILKWSLVGMAIVLVLIGVAIAVKLRPAEQPQAAPTTAETSVAAPSTPVTGGVECPVTVLAGREYSCLGAGGLEPRPVLKPTVVTVWAYWCEPCRRELPLLEEFAAQHPEVQVLGMHADKNAAAGLAMLQELNVSLPSLVDADGVFAASVEAPQVVPLLVFFDEQGNHLTTTALSPKSVADIEQAAAAAGIL